MEAKECIITRRSIRKFTNQKVDHDTIKDLVETASYSPSWKNTQVTRYYVIENKEIINSIADNCVLGFELNINTIKGAPILVVLAFKKGISGYEKSGEATTEQGSHWESFDTGIAAQTFCLAAKDKGIGTVIMGVFDDKKVSELLGLSEDEGVAGLIALGYPAINPKAPKRKSLDEILKII